VDYRATCKIKNGNFMDTIYVFGKTVVNYFTENQLL